MQYNQPDAGNELIERLLELSKEDESVGYEPVRKLERFGQNQGLSKWGSLSEELMTTKRSLNETTRPKVISRKEPERKKRNLLPTLEQLARRFSRNNSEQSRAQMIPPTRKTRRHSEAVAAEMAHDRLGSPERLHHEPKKVSISLEMPIADKVLKLYRRNNHLPVSIPLHINSPVCQRKQKHISLSPEIRLTRKAEQMKLLNEQITIYLNPIVARHMMELKNPNSKFSSIRYAHQKNIKLGLAKNLRKAD